jgi:hypothetical protein
VTISYNSEERVDGKHVELWNILIGEDVWGEWHRRTTLAFTDLGIPLTPLETVNDLYFDKDFFAERFQNNVIIDDKGESKPKPKPYLMHLFDGREIEIPTLALPKANLLINESIKINDEQKYRTNRIRGSRLTASILFGLYPDSKALFKVLRSMASYAPTPMWKDEFLPKGWRYRWSLTRKSKVLKKWIKKRLQPYLGTTVIDNLFSEVFPEDNDFNEILENMERLWKQWSESKADTNVALNPFLAIQDYVSLYGKPDVSYLQGINAILNTHLKWQKKNDPNLTKVARFLGDLFWAFIKIPLKFNEDIKVSHTQKITEVNPINFQYALRLNEAKSLHLNFQLPSNVMKFKGKRWFNLEGINECSKRRMVQSYCDKDKKWVKYKEPVSVFGRIRFSDKSIHFYTTKNSVRLPKRRDGKSEDKEARLVRVNLRQRLSTPTILSLIVIISSIATLDIATILTGEPALWGSLALVSTLFMTFASLPREDPVFIHKIGGWLWLIGGFMMFGLMAGFISMLEHLFPGLYIWNALWEGILSLVGL